MLRKLAIAIAASGAMMSASTTYALGMGDIELDSALNQPLEARIKLLKASELEDWEIKPDLASREEFKKSGVERVFFLNSFKFEIERTDSGVYVNLSSDQPVVEPFLNFLVQVDWPSGRLLREYTLLLDPPVFAEEAPQRVEAPVEQDTYASESDDFESESAETASALPGTGGVMEEPAAPVVEPKQEIEEQKQKTYRVQENDTLWEVAIKTRDNRSITPQQAMLAIQDLNPDAFINGNINRLKKNQVLRVPTEDQMMSRTFGAAVSEVAMQNQAVAKRKAQLDATRKDKAMMRDDSVADARLKLLAGGDATTEANRGASGKVVEKAAGDQSSLENDLNLALENLDKSTLENQELRTRLDSLEEQINTLQRLINLKDEQMVALQTGMSSGAKEAPVKEVVAKEAMTKDIIAKAPKPTVDDKSADLNFESPEKAVVAAKKPDAKVDGAKVESNGADVAASKKDLENAKPKPKFVYTPPVEEEPFDVVAFAIENPQIPGAVIGALLLALLAVNRRRKSKEDSSEDIAENQFEGQDPLDNVDGELEDDFHSEFDDLQLGGDDGTASEFDAGDFESTDLDDVAQADAGLPDSLDDADLGEGQDVLGEVDVYMAYNRVEPAKELLEKTLQQQPGRNELRVKLLEVLAETDDQSTFDDHFEQVMNSGDENEKSQAEAIKARLGSAGADDLSGDLGLGLDSLDSNDGEFGLDLDEGELDFDLDGLDLTSDLDAPAKPQESNEISHDSTLDFDMDLSDFDADSVETSIAEDSLPDLDVDSGLDFSSELDSLELSSSDDGDELTSLDIDTNADESVGLELDAGLDLDLGGADDLDLGSLDDDLSLDASSSLDSEDGLDLDDSLESLSLDAEDDLSLDMGDDLSFDSEVSTDIEIPELGDVEESLGLAGEEVDLGLESDLEIPSLDDELSLDSLSDELSDISTDIEESEDLDLDLGSIDNGLEDESLDLSDLDSGLDLDVEIPSLDAEVSSDSVELDGEADAEEGLVDLATLDESDDLPPLGDLDLDNLDEDLDFLSGTDESETKLDLARAYIDMDDKDGAKEILQEVLEEGTEQQKEDASKLMDSMA